MQSAGNKTSEVQTSSLIRSCATMTSSKTPNGSANYGTLQCTKVKKIVLTWDRINVFSPPTQTPKSVMSRLKTLFNTGNKDKSSCQKDGFSDHKHILKCVSGMVEPGTLLAVMGSSGAGKTTLLNVLTFRNKGNLIIQGEVKINGIKIEKAMPGVSCYVQQENLFSTTITVKEQLWFHSQLRMDREATKEMRKKKVEEVLVEMGLQKCSDFLIGVPGKTKGISGGEKKRLALALELLTNPPLMFLDEPMSGLDSYMASNVFTTLKKLSESGRSIICTIHQPSSEMFEMFDKLLILSEGRVAYFGAANETEKHFTSCQYPLPPNYNPAEHFTKVLAVIPGFEDVSRKRISQICDQYELSQYSLYIQDRIEAFNSIEDKSLLTQKQSGKESLYRATWCRQFFTILWRCSADTLREPSVFWIKFIHLSLVALLLGLIFWQQELDQKGVTNLNGILFYMQLQLSFNIALGTVLIYTPELPLVFKEHLDGMYRMDVYFLCKNIVEIPIIVTQSLSFTTILYWTVGLYRNIEAYLIAYSCIAVVSFTAFAFGSIFTLAIDNPKISSPTITLLCALITLIGGFFLHPGSIPFYFAWLEAISWVVRSNEILIVNQWSRIDSIECELDDGNITDNRGGKCFRNGDEIIDFNGYHKDKIGFNFLVIIMLLVLFKLIAFICLLIRSRGSYKMEKSKKSF